MVRMLFALPFAAAALLAAAPSPASAQVAPAPVAPAPVGPAPIAPAQVIPTATALRPVPINAPADVVGDPANQLTLELSNGGRVLIQLRPDAAPLMIERIKTLVGQGFYSGLLFHRVIPGFMAQGGDPKGDGSGGSTLPDVKSEFTTLPHLRGTVSAARADSPDSANSQFYIMLAPRMSLDGKYTAFGRVIQGMSFVDQIAPGEPPAEPTRIVRATIGAGTSPAPEAASPGPPATSDQAPPATPKS